MVQNFRGCCKPPLLDCLSHLTPWAACQLRAEFKELGERIHPTVFLKNLPEEAGAFDVFAAFPDLNRPIAEFCEILFRGPSFLTPGERQTLFVYVSGFNACQYCYGGHTAAVAYGLDPDVFDTLFDDIETASVDDKLKPLFRWCGN